MNEYLELDLLTLNAISENAGRPIDELVYFKLLEKAITDGFLFNIK